LRAFRLAACLLALVTVSFLLVHLIPGDPARTSLGMFAPQELVDARRQELGLDRPLAVQYASYLQKLAHGDLGVSIVDHQPVAQVLAERLPATLALAAGALLIVLVAGIGGGLAAAVLASGRPRPAVDATFHVVSSVLAAMPEFVSATALMALFGVLLAWVPVAGRAGAASYILPTLALAIGPSAAMARIVRVEGLRVLEQEYIRTARAKRLRALRVYAVHVLPNCLTATLTVAGLILGGLVAGSVLVESVFAWPGVGSAVVLSILQKDYPLTQGVVLTLGALILLINFVVDLLITTLDPRSALGET
jgi:peptide/nickel transport system permease protein